MPDYEDKNIPALSKEELKLPPHLRDSMTSGGDASGRAAGPAEDEDEKPARSSAKPRPPTRPFVPGAGAAILDEVEAAIRKYVILPNEEAYIAATCWVAATHKMPALEHATRLALISAVPGCGKSRTLEVLECLSENPLAVSSATTSAIFRSLDGAVRTVFHDEIDTVFGVRGDEDLRGLYNAGFRRGQTFLRSAKEEGEWMPREYNVFAMVGLASKGDVIPETVMQRSIVIRMRKKLPNERVENFRSRHMAALRALGKKVSHWADTVNSEVDPDNPLENREADVWEPLFIMADAAGKEWPEKARKAALAMTASEKEVATPDRSVDLLRDILYLWPLEKGEPQDHWWTADMLRALVEYEDGAWDNYEYGRELDPIQLASMLRGFGFAPKLIKRKGKVGRGYNRAWFEDAAARYLKDEEPEG